METNEIFNENLSYINEFKNLIIRSHNIYGDKEVDEINNLIDTIKSKLLDKASDEIENDISDLKSRIDKVSASNEKELQERFNDINNSISEILNDEEKNIINGYINEYNELLKNKEYILAREKLDEIDSWISEAKKESNIKKINENYDLISSKDPSLREPKYINGILIVNKEHGLPDTYAPGENQEAREAFERMKADAAKDGIYLNAFSTYRSYWSQYTLYNNYISEYGEAPTDTFSARAGFSEHQTGLAFDIGGVDKSLWSDENFQYTEEAKWLKENCTKYGFILRYPEGKEWITGYMYESWHFRYIGVEHSKYFENNNLTLEEYLGLN
ncbi:MAG: D-alanyl-D-alanine carboxypeptidase family protein [Clostridium sp.]|nr:D-alanyl-D-alanine carboxypeptidase family protein [Clostridium sp.]